MKVYSSNENNRIPENAYQQTDIHPKNWMAGDRDNHDENISGINGDKHKSTRKVLTSNELSALHLLFGSKKPEEMIFYGQNKVQMIHKGQLIDISG